MIYHLKNDTFLKLKKELDGYVLYQNKLNMVLIQQIVPSNKIKTILQMNCQ